MVPYLDDLYGDGLDAFDELIFLYFVRLCFLFRLLFDGLLFFCLQSVPFPVKRVTQFTPARRESNATRRTSFF